MAQFRILIFSILIIISRQAVSQELSYGELKSQRTRRLCVHYLDGYLCLSQEQHRELEELLQKKWTSGMDSCARGLLWVGYRAGHKVFNSLRSSELEGILSEDQVRQFESLSETALNQSDQLDYLRGWLATPSDPITPSLTQAISLELQRLEKLLDLDADQVRVLRIAAKGAAKNVLDERQKWRRQLIDGERNLEDSEWCKVAVECPVFRIRESEVWNRAMKKVLTEQQFAIHLEDKTAQSIVSTRVSAHSMTMCYFHNTKISQNEYQRFTKLIEDGIAKAQLSGQINHHGSLAFDGIEVLIELEDEQIRATLTAENWGKLKPTIERVRDRRANNRQGEN